MLRGSCLCGAIWFEAAAPMRDPAACHCLQCRRQSGHHWASVRIDDKDLRIEGDPKWYRASPEAKRGFCPTCGAFLFWKRDRDNDTSIALGALESPTGLTLTRHIFVEEQGDYYEIDGNGPEDDGP